MKDLEFPQPVTVLVGLGFVRSVTNVYDAFSCLREVPAEQQDEVHEAALDACRDAMSGKCPAEEACDVFIAYARRRHILVEDHLAIQGTAVAELTAA